MDTRLVILALGLLAFTTAVANDVPITDVSTDINTENNDPEIWIEIWIGKSIDADATTSLWKDIIAELVNAKTSRPIKVMTPTANSDRIALKVDDPNAELGRQIGEKSLAVFVRLSGDLELVFDDGTTGAITPDRMKELSSRVNLEAADLAALEAVAAGQQRIYEDKIDVAREVDAEDSSRVDYALNFRLHQPVADTRLSFESRGRVSTNQENPLNQVALFLVGRTGVIEKRMGAPIFCSFHLEAGVVGTQTFDVASAAVDAGIDVLFPNFLDLTGGANRLGLKPVAGASIGYKRLSRDLDLFGKNRDCIEIRVELDYGIPVLEAYLLGVSSRAIFNDKAEGDNWFHRTSASLAYDLPPKDLKLLAKWEIGRNEFSSTEDSKVLLGLVADYLPF
ncbi:MAG: hypothetical protein ABIK65_01065 [Candidatus Eisenbacteria bacterium]